MTVMSERRAYMNSYTVAARRKGIMLKDLIILISDEVHCSVSELSRALNAKEAEKHLEPKQEKIVESVEKLLNSLPDSENPAGNDITLRIAAQGKSMAKLHEEYTSKYDHKIGYKAWLNAVLSPYTAGEYAIKKKTEILIDTLEAENGRGTL